MTSIMIGFTRARHLLGTVYGNYTLTSIDTGINVYGSGLRGVGGATLSLPAIPSTNQWIEIINTGTGTVTVTIGTIVKDGIDYGSAELVNTATSIKARIRLRWNGTKWDVLEDSGTVNYIVAVTYATWNPADKGTQTTLSNGDLTATFGISSQDAVRSTISKSAGKWYWEYNVDVFTVAPGAGDSTLGLGIATVLANMNVELGQTVFGWAYRSKPDHVPDTVDKFHGAGSSVYGSAFGVGNTVGVALDMDAGLITFYLDGVSQGVAWADLLDAASAIFAAIGCVDNDGVTVATITANFGASAFAYSVPSGYNAGLYS